MTLPPPQSPGSPGPDDEPRRDGVAVVDKEAGWTSHDVVAKARGILRNKKIGHAGTLDPDATGVLVLGVGRATRLLRFLTLLSKQYVGDIVLGVETSTLDAAGEVTATHDMSSVTLDAARAAAVALTGEIQQVPPMVSAVRIGGQRLHELARQGIEVEREARPVTVHRFDLRSIPGETGVLRADVECSSGTYVRTLAADLGRALGGGAHLRNLRRTAVGSFTLADARPLDEIEVLPIEQAVRDLPTVTVDERIARAVGHGKVLERADLLPGGRGAGPDADGPWAVCGPDGRLLAVYERHRDTTVKPAVVVAPAGDG
jgi:tRNA pseudouridine55 synthase